MEKLTYWIKFICITIATILAFTGLVWFFTWFEAWLVSLHFDPETYIAGGVIIGMGMMVAYLILDQ